MYNASLDKKKKKCNECVNVRTLADNTVRMAHCRPAARY